MANESQQNPPLPDFWALRQQVRDIDRRLGDTERRIEQRAVEVDRRMERIEAKTELIPTVSLQVTNLASAVANLTSKFDEMTTSSSGNRRSEWTLVLQIVSFAVMALIAILSLVIAFLHAGRLG